MKAHMNSSLGALNCAPAGAKVPKCGMSNNRWKKVVLDSKGSLSFLGSRVLVKKKQKHGVFMAVRVGSGNGSSGMGPRIWNGNLESDVELKKLKSSYNRLTKSQLIDMIIDLQKERNELISALGGEEKDESSEMGSVGDGLGDVEHVYESVDDVIAAIEQGINWPSAGSEFWKNEARDKPCKLADDMQDLGDPMSSYATTNALHVVHVTAEMAPLAKVGGLGDVVTGLSASSIRKGHKIEIILPFYECIDIKGIENLQFERKFESPTGQEENGMMQHKSMTMESWTGVIEGCPVVLLRPDWEASGSNMFRGGAIYGGSYNETNAYLTFCRASLEYLSQSGRRPDIIHAHEWQSAAVPMIFWELYSSTMPNTRPVSGCMAQISHCQFGTPQSHYFCHQQISLFVQVFTIHNMDNSGECRQDEFAATGMSGDVFATVERALDERTIGHNPERLCLLKGGVVYSSVVTTVSPTYAKETLTGGSAGWLQSTLARPEIAAKYVGVLNGIDTNVWNPAIDPYIPACFSSSIPQGKALCKKYVQRGLGMEEKPDAPLVAVISRLVPQKGIHLIERAVGRTEEMGGQFVLLGTGHAAGGLQNMAQHVYADNPNVAMLFMYSEPLSHLIYAAADMFLVPSMFEPCGLTQMIALRYGAVPIVRCTGGLADTVHDVDEGESTQHSASDTDGQYATNSNKGNGYVFHGVDAASLDEALERAFSLYKNNPEAWKALSIKNMRESTQFSWDGAAASYEQLYAGATGQ